MDESLEDAARRQTETGLDDIYLEQLYTWGDVGRDPRTRGHQLLLYGSGG